MKILVLGAGTLDGYYGGRRRSDVPGQANKGRPTAEEWTRGAESSRERGADGPHHHTRPGHARLRSRPADVQNVRLGSSDRRNGASGWGAYRHPAVAERHGDLGHPGSALWDGPRAGRGRLYRRHARAVGAYPPPQPWRHTPDRPESRGDHDPRGIAL